MKENYRIGDIRVVTLNGQPAKLFVAWEKRGPAFEHIGQYSAPADTADDDLWEIAAQYEISS